MLQLKSRRRRTMRTRRSPRVSEPGLDELLPAVLSLFGLEDEHAVKSLTNVIEGHLANAAPLGLDERIERCVCIDGFYMIR